ncbi:MAG: tyrosine-protein phosphatase [Acidobacteria bacterium]|nr:tyrosine-protein phosphatase [Acidobacteriota bacterium]
MKLQGISLFQANRALFGRALTAIVAFCLVFSLIEPVSAASDRNIEKRSEVEESDVKNFGRVNNHIFRGGQPKDDEYGELAAIGIKTVIDLREDAENYARRSTEGAGMRYVNLRLNAKQPPTAGESERFLALVNDQRNWPVFVHCAGGRHRTGVLIAVYRMEMDGWDANRAYREMKDFKFYKRWGYGDMKEYVFDYFNRMTDRRAQAASTRARRVAESGRDD